MSVLQQNYQDVCQAVEQAAEAAGRPADAVKLVAVSKTFPADDIREVYAAGQRDFGENYIQEWFENGNAGRFAGYCLARYRRCAV